MHRDEPCQCHASDSPVCDQIKTGKKHQCYKKIGNSIRCPSHLPQCANKLGQPEQECQSSIHDAGWATQPHNQCGKLGLTHYRRCPRRHELGQVLPCHDCVIRGRVADPCCGRQDARYVNKNRTTLDMARMIIPIVGSHVCLNDPDCLKDVYLCNDPKMDCAPMQARCALHGRCACAGRLVQHDYAPSHLDDTLEFVGI
jgi:hypothetical protein